MKKVTNNHLEPGEAMPSFFCSIASGKSSPLINREEIMRIIRFDEMTRSRTEEYRRRLSISKQEAQKVKLQMPGITISAQMNGNGKELRDVLKVLPYAALDYDNVDAELLGECVRKVKNDPFTMVEYITASGKGLRIIVAYETSQDDDLSSLEVFEASLAKATAHYNRLLGIQADKACKDVTRTCGLAHDPDAYFNWTSHAFTLSTKEMAKIYTKREMDHRQAKRRSRRPSDKGGTGKSQGAPSMEHAAPSILAMLEGQGRVFEAGSHNDYLVRFAFICLHYGINYDEVQTYVSAHFAGDYPDAAAVVKSCYKHTESLGDWHFYEEGESYAKRPSTKAVKQWLGMRYEFHQNVVTGFYELRSLDVQKGRFPGRRSTTTSRTPSGVTWTPRGSASPRRRSTP